MSPTMGQIDWGHSAQTGVGWLQEGNEVGDQIALQKFRGGLWGSTGRAARNFIENSFEEI